jgi:putative redox protein
MSVETTHPNHTELRSHSGNGPPDSHAFPAPANGLCVVPNGRREGFHASIRSHELELADPDSVHALVPTPADLFISSIASDFAWSAQRFLRSRRLPDEVSVSAAWRMHKDSPRLSDVDMTVTVSNSAEAVSATLVAALKNSFAARSLNAPIRVQIRGA